MSAPIYILRLTPVTGTDGDKALRWVLKVLLRRFGLRCISVEQEKDNRLWEDMWAKSLRESNPELRQ